MSESGLPQARQSLQTTRSAMGSTNPLFSLKVFDEQAVLRKRLFRESRMESAAEYNQHHYRA